MQREPYTVVVEQRAEEPPPPQNGAAPPVPVAAPPSVAVGAPAPSPPSGPGPRLPRRTAVVALPEEYPGFTVTLWVNFPQRLLQEVASGDQERAAAALSRIVLAHNGWCDEEGAPYPPPTEPAFWDQIPTELAAVVLALVNREATRLPNSLLARSRG